MVVPDTSMLPLTRAVQGARVEVASGLGGAPSPPRLASRQRRQNMHALLPPLPLSIILPPPIPDPGGCLVMGDLAELLLTMPEAEGADRK